MDIEVTVAIRTVAVLIYAFVAISDLRTREAPNTAWIVLLGLGVLGLVVDSISIRDLVGLALVVTIVSVVSVIAFRKGVIGGADAKAVMVLPVIFPRVPGSEVWNGVFGVLLQGLEVLIVVSVVAGIAGLVWQLQLDDDDERGVPFLVPIFISTVALFAIGV